MEWATGLQFYYVTPNLKVVNNIFQQNSLNAIVFKLQVIYSAMEWATGLQFYYVIADSKVAE